MKCEGCALKGGLCIPCHEQLVQSRPAASLEDSPLVSLRHSETSISGGTCFALKPSLGRVGLAVLLFLPGGVQRPSQRCPGQLSTICGLGRVCSSSCRPFLTAPQEGARAAWAEPEQFVPYCCSSSSSISRFGCAFSPTAWPVCRGACCAAAPPGVPFFSV